MDHSSSPYAERNPPIMKCGHAANATYDNNGKKSPCCVICFGSQGAVEIDHQPPDLTGRQAKCSSCGKNIVPSIVGLPFFEYRGPGSHAATQCKNCGWYPNAHPSQGGTGYYQGQDKPLPHLCENEGKTYEPMTEGQPYDTYYCGCWGWD